MKKKRQVTNNELAASIAHLGNKVAKGFEEVLSATNTAFTGVQEQLDDLKTGQNHLAKRMTGMELSQQVIKERLDYHAPKFEVDDLKKRVTRLEKKTGIASA